ncbi:MAG: hypothetical protein LBQ77_08295 [Treponema sp.]|jgi:hypothetical protein|nr:hypothetical protein [Treponema sp.]
MQWAKKNIGYSYGYALQNLVFVRSFSASLHFLLYPRSAALHGEFGAKKLCSTYL